MFLQGMCLELGGVVMNSIWIDRLFCHPSELIESVEVITPAFFQECCTELGITICRTTGIKVHYNGMSKESKKLASISSIPVPAAVLTSSYTLLFLFFFFPVLSFI